MKYEIGSLWYMKGKYKDLNKEDLVEITDRIKEGRHTFVDVQDIQGNQYYHINVKKLRKRKH